MLRPVIKYGSISRRLLGEILSISVKCPYFDEIMIFFKIIKFIFNMINKSCVLNFNGTDAINL